MQPDVQLLKFIQKQPHGYNHHRDDREERGLSPKCNIPNIEKHK